MNKNKAFLKTVMTLVIPLALQNLINVSVQSADVIMLGRVSETVLSASSLAGQINYMLNLTLFGLSSGAAVLTSQYWGKGDRESIKKILGIALRISLGISIAVTAITFFFPEYLMGIFSSDPEVIAAGVRYLRIVCFSYILSSFTMVYLNIMRSVEKVIISSFVYLTSLVVNIIINSLLIYGLFGFPALGISGAAIGTLIARSVEVLIVIIYDKKYNDIIKLKLKYIFAKEKILLRDFLFFSLPVVFNEILWGAGMAANAAIMGNMSSTAAAASSVVQVTRQLATIISFGIAGAAAISIGKAIGEAKIDKAKEYGNKFVILSIIAGIFGAIVVIIVRPIALNIMNLSQEAHGYLSSMMFSMSVYVLINSFTCTAIVGIFRAGGDTKIGLAFDAISMWLGSILIGFLAAFVFKLSVPVVFMILLIDELIKLPLVVWRYRSYKWLKNITR